MKLVSCKRCGETHECAGRLSNRERAVKAGKALWAKGEREEAVEKLVAGTAAIQRGFPQVPMPPSPALMHLEPEASELARTGKCTLHGLRKCQKTGVCKLETEYVEKMGKGP